MVAGFSQRRGKYFPGENPPTVTVTICKAQTANRKTELGALCTIKISTTLMLRQHMQKMTITLTMTTSNSNHKKPNSKTYITHTHTKHTHTAINPNNLRTSWKGQRVC